MSDKSDNKSEKSVIYVMVISMIAMVIMGFYEMSDRSHEEVKYIWVKDSEMYAFFLSEGNMSLMLESSKSVASFIKNIKFINQSQGFWDSIEMPGIYHKLPVIVEFISRRIILVIFVGLVCVPLFIYNLLNGLWQREKRMVGHGTPSPYFGSVGSNLLVLGIIYLATFPFASLPLTGDMLKLIIAFTGMIFIVHLTKGQWEFGIPLLFILCSVYLGPAGALSGSIIMLTGIYTLSKHWSDFI